MKIFMGIAVGWACSRIFRHLNSVRRTNAAQQKNIPNTQPLEFTKETRDEPPAHLLTEIESFSSFLEYPIEKYESRVFSAGGYKWRLVIYPDGEHISAYLEMVNCVTCLKVYATFEIYLFNRTSDNYLCFRGTAADFTKLRSKWGFRKLVLVKTLRHISNGYVVDDKCVFGAQVSVIERVSFIEITWTESTKMETMDPVIYIAFVLFLVSLGVSCYLAVDLFLLHPQ